MKSRCFITVFLLLVVGICSINAQDLIVLKDGNMIESRVIEISPTEIRYRRLDHLDGPVIVVPAVNVLSIRYQNGRVETINAAPATAEAQEVAQPAARQANYGQRNHFISGSIGYMSGIALGLNYERKFERVSWGADAFFSIGEDLITCAGSATFKVFPAPIFFLGADLGLSLWLSRWYDSFGVQFTPQLGFRIGGRNQGFFMDLFFAVPMHIGTGGFDIAPRPGTRIGGSW